MTEQKLLQSAVFLLDLTEARAHGAYEAMRTRCGWPLGHGYQLWGGQSPTRSLAFLHPVQ